MKDPMKSRDKITQKMSRDGPDRAKPDHGRKRAYQQAHTGRGFSENAGSSKPHRTRRSFKGRFPRPLLLPHAPEHFSKPQDAAAERVMEHIGAGQTRKASKKAVRRAQEAAASKAQPSRLQFTDEERANAGAGKVHQEIGQSRRPVWTQRGRHFPQRRNRGCNLTSRKRRRASRASAIPYPAPRRKAGIFRP